MRLGEREKLRTKLWSFHFLCMEYGAVRLHLYGLISYNCFGLLTYLLMALGQFCSELKPRWVGLRVLLEQTAVVDDCYGVRVVWLAQLYCFHGQLWYCFLWSRS